MAKGDKYRIMRQPSHHRASDDWVTGGFFRGRGGSEKST